MVYSRGGGVRWAFSVRIGIDLNFVLTSDRRGGRDRGGVGERFSIPGGDARCPGGFAAVVALRAPRVPRCGKVGRLSFIFIGAASHGGS